jgi:flagellar M-ring protein FliF
VELRDRLLHTWQALPVAHRIGMGAAAAGLLMVSVIFFQWVSAPSYTVLASGLGDSDVARIVDRLEADGVPYEIGSGGSTVLVPRNELYRTRASLAQAGIAPSSGPVGYELLDGQGLTVSDFRQQIDYKRALEGELARTLMAMDGIRSATVHLVLPRQELFTERQQPTTASVLLDTARTLTAGEVEAVTFLVASSVEGLEAGGITVADAAGTVLHAPGDGAVPGAIASRQLRETRDFEAAMAADITALLGRATGSPASVVVRARLNFDESSTETERFNPDGGATLREQTMNESFEGSGVVTRGAVGVDGGPLGDGDGESTYQRDEVLREYGVDREVTVTRHAPGQIERLSVAIVMDDGTLTGAAVPNINQVEQLVSAAVGLDAERGDSVAVTAVPFPTTPDMQDAPAGVAEMMEHVPQIIALLVLILVAAALFLMTRRRGDDVAPALSRPEREGPMIVVDEPAPEPVEAAAARPLAPRPDESLKQEVSELVDRQPEEIAALLRSWLADQRSA